MCGRISFGLPALEAHYHTLHVRRSPAALTRLSPEQRVHSTWFNERCPFDILEMAYWGGEGETCLLLLMWCDTKRCVLYLVGYHNFTSEMWGCETESCTQDSGVMMTQR